MRLPSGRAAPSCAPCRATRRARTPPTMPSGGPSTSTSWTRSTGWSGCPTTRTSRGRCRGRSAPTARGCGSVAVSRDERDAAAVAEDGRSLYVTELSSGAERGRVRVHSQGGSAERRADGAQLGRAGRAVGRRPRSAAAAAAAAAGRHRRGGRGRAAAARRRPDQGAAGVRGRHEDRDCWSSGTAIRRCGWAGSSGGARPTTEFRCGSCTRSRRSWRTSTPRPGRVDSRLVVAGRESDGVQQLQYVETDGSPADLPEVPGPNGVDGGRRLGGPDAGRWSPRLRENGIVRLPPNTDWKPWTRTVPGRSTRDSRGAGGGPGPSDRLPRHGGGRLSTCACFPQGVAARPVCRDSGGMRGWWQEIADLVLPADCAGCGAAGWPAVRPVSWSAVRARGGAGCCRARCRRGCRWSMRPWSTRTRPGRCCSRTRSGERCGWRGRWARRWPGRCGRLRSRAHTGAAWAPPALGQHRLPLGASPPAGAGALRAAGGGGAGP